ncbi:GTP cyclohydrolase II RibA [Salinisphaera orenii]|uniref:GTP cyclohydrolase-2 n=1 Tax=Salinisphaera orenii YIM 95161 TaxID=1051139 RepID=A0A423PSJ0_9GAMM|nr:GTP cyclohydrolase II RibA [Salinisphaera halophila]ROO28579.1 GTP cyclohydrolase [Salinisphaera halophila YIM 95161]
MRQIERSIFDLRRGVPVLVRGRDRDTLVAPLEGLTDETLTRLRATTGNPPALVVTRHRLERMGIEIAADAARLSLTDGDSAQTVVAWACARHVEHSPHQRPTDVDRESHAALALMRRGLLIPAAVTATIDASRREAVQKLIDDQTLLAIDVDRIEAYESSAIHFLRRISAADVPLADAEKSRFVLFREADGVREHIAIVIGEPEFWRTAVPVRLHSACLTGDLFGSLRCDCGEQLRSSVATIAERGGGVLLYLAQEGRGIGLANKLRAYSLQDDGLDTVDADQVLGFGDDERDYNVALEMLAQLEIRRIELLTNNPAKIAAMSGGGIAVVQRSGVYGRLTAQNERYLTAKAARSGHWLDNVLGKPSADVAMNGKG